MEPGPRMISSSAIRIFLNLHCNKNPIYVFLFWELCRLPGEVVEPGTAHDLQPCNQDFLMYTATKIPFMYSSSGNFALDLQPCNHYLFFMYTAMKIPFMYSSPENSAHDLQPCNKDSAFFSVHCNKNPIYLFLIWELCA
jgi:hypothetical protein